MSSLIYCIEKYASSLEGYEVASLERRAKEYMDKGYSPQLANISSIKDHMKSYDAEIADIFNKAQQAGWTIPKEVEGATRAATQQAGEVSAKSELPKEPGEIKKEKAKPAFPPILKSEKGSIEIELTPRQKMQLAQVRKQIDKLKENAVRAGKTLDQYLLDLGMDKKLVGIIKAQETGKEKKQPEKISGETESGPLKYKETIDDIKNDLSDPIIAQFEQDNKFSKHWRKLRRALSYDYRGKTTGKIETFQAIKQRNSIRDRWNIYGLSQARKALKSLKRGPAGIKGLSRKDGAMAVIYHENPKLYAELPESEQARFKPAIEILNKIQEEIRQEEIKRGVPASVLDFKSRVISEIKDMIELAESEADKIALQKALQEAEQINFTHIPSAIWFENLAGKDPARASKILGVVLNQKRKNLSIKSLIDRGVLKLDDINIADVIASYARRGGRDIANLDIINAAIKENLAVDLSKIKDKALQEKYKAFWPQIPWSNRIFKQYRVHPFLLDILKDIRELESGKRSALREMNVLFKLAAFYNPGFLGLMDFLQGTMLGSFLPHATGIFLGGSFGGVPGAAIGLGAAEALTRGRISRGFYHAVKMTPEYFKALDNNIASQPFSLPWNQFESQLKRMKRTNPEIAMALMKNTYPPRLIKNIYKTSFYVAWHVLDHGMRMSAYSWLLGKGFEPKRAGKIVAKAFSDYGNLSPRASRALNLFFFTAPFKVTMGQLFLKSFKNAFIERPIKQVQKTILGRKIDPQEWKEIKRYSSVPVKVLGILMAFDFWMTQYLGLKRDEAGRRYYKEIQTPQGPKELVVVGSGPPNMWLKYLYRGIEANKPWVEKPLVNFILANKWEYNRLVQVGYETVVGEDATGTPLFNHSDNTAVRTAKRLMHLITRAVPLLTLVYEDPSNKEANEIFAKEYGKLLSMVTRPFLFRYTRSIPEKRALYRLTSITEMVKKDIYRETKKALQEKRPFKLNKAWIDKYLKDINEVMKSLPKK